MLIDASKRGDLRKLVELHESGADLLCTDQYGMTALHHAARFGHKEIVKYLVRNGRCIIELHYYKRKYTLNRVAFIDRLTCSDQIL